MKCCLVLLLFLIINHYSLAQVRTASDGELCLEGSSDLYIDIAACSRAIADRVEQDMQLGTFYAARGRAFHYTHQADNALEDLNKAITLNPLSVMGFNNRGLVHHKNADYKKALADFNQAIELNPNHAQVYRNRGISYYFMGDNITALLDFSLALRKQAHDPEALIFQGLARYRQNMFKQAAADFAAVENLYFPYPYTLLWRYLSLRAAGIEDKQILLDAIEEFGERDWPGPLYAFYLERVNEQTVLQAVFEDTKQQAEAHFFIGQYALLQEERDKARSHFQIVLDFGISHSIEYFNAKIALDD